MVFSKGVAFAPCKKRMIDSITLVIGEAIRVQALIRGFWLLSEVDRRDRPIRGTVSFWSSCFAGGDGVGERIWDSVGGALVPQEVGER